MKLSVYMIQSLNLLYVTYLPVFPIPSLQKEEKKKKKKDLWFFAKKKKSNQLILYFNCSGKNAGFHFFSFLLLPPSPSLCSFALLLFHRSCCSSLSLYKAKEVYQQVCDLCLNGIVQSP